MLTILVTCVVKEILYQIAQMPKTLHKWPKNVHLSPKCTNAQKIEQNSQIPQMAKICTHVPKNCKVGDFMLMQGRRFCSYASFCASKSCQNTQFIYTLQTIKVPQPKA